MAKTKQPTTVRHDRLSRLPDDHVVINLDDFSSWSNKLLLPANFAQSFVNLMQELRQVEEIEAGNGTRVFVDKGSVRYSLRPTEANREVCASVGMEELAKKFADYHRGPVSLCAPAPKYGRFVVDPEEFAVEEPKEES